MKLKHIITKENILPIVKECHSLREVCEKLNVADGGRPFAMVKKVIRDNGIDISHFDRNFKRRKYSIVSKSCPVCLKVFKTKEHHRLEKTYCSKKCCNSLKLGKRFSEESNLKISQGLKDFYQTEESVKARIKISEGNKLYQASLKRNYISSGERDNRNRLIYPKTCIFCKKEFKTIKPKSRYCCSFCAAKDRIDKGLHKGWLSRNKLSYPEKFFKEVLDSNGYKDKYITNDPISKNSLGINNASCYFLDFHFRDFKFDLEIDGSQHNLPDRKESDARRDGLLKSHGYTVYRIKWKNPVTDKNKAYMKEEIEKLLNILDNFLVV